MFPAESLDLPVAAPDGALDAQLCFALYAASNAMTRTYRPMLTELGLTYPQLLVMLVLWEEGRVTAGHVARRLELAPNAMTPLLARLEEAGLIARAPDPEDRRRTWLAATEAGRTMEARADAVRRAVACATGLDDAAVAELRARLQGLSHTLSASG